MRWAVKRHAPKSGLGPNLSAFASRTPPLAPARSAPNRRGRMSPPANQCCALVHRGASAPNTPRGRHEVPSSTAERHRSTSAASMATARNAPGAKRWATSATFGPVLRAPGARERGSRLGHAVLGRLAVVAPRGVRRPVQPALGVRPGLLDADAADLGIHDALAVAFVRCQPQVQSLPDAVVLRRRDDLADRSAGALRLGALRLRLAGAQRFVLEILPLRHVFGMQLRRLPQAAVEGERVRGERREGARTTGL
mmetsp:Transcript_37567/g.74810  ORF Transcript_37567/g.74810 Transcript_37567/m.74810 type:complete len:253 (+) Transcript_37567:222-980(+)